MGEGSFGEETEMSTVMTVTTVEIVGDGGVVEA